MSGYYTPSLEELKASWVEYRTGHAEELITMQQATEEFNRTMDEFGNEMYEDGYSEGYGYGLMEFYPGESIDGPRSM